MLHPLVYLQIRQVRITWDDLVATIERYVKHFYRKCCSLQYDRGGYSPFVQALYNRMNNVVRLHSRRVSMKERKAVDIVELLSEFRSRNATDPRDKLFGLMGLMHTVGAQNNDLCVEADYEIETKVLYEWISATVLTSEAESLDFLMNRQGESERDPALPTWAIDWRAQIDASYDLLYRSLRQNTHLYDASGIGLKFCGLVKQDLRLMRVRGRLLDRVAMLMDPRDEPPDPSTSTAALQDLGQKFDRLFDSHHLGRSGSQQNREHIFWRLLCLDVRNEMVISSDNSEVGTQTIKRFSRCDLTEYAHTTRGLTIQAFDDHWNVEPDLSRPLEAWACLAMFATHDGHFGMGPLTMQNDDRICIFLGARVPYVVRPCLLRSEDGDEISCYQVVGFCYLDGFMDGEAFTGMLAGELLQNTEWIDLV